MELAGSTAVAITADLKPFEDGLAQARQRTEEYTRQAEQTFSKTVRAVDEMSASARAYAQQLQAISELQQRINATTGVKDQSTVAATTSARAADVAAYGQELDNLRAKYNPLFAAQQEYRAQLDEIDTALRVGALSEEEHARAVAATKTAYDAQVQGIDAAGHAAGKTNGQMMALQHSLRAMAEGVIMGTPPTMILGQQMSHLSYVASGPSGLSGAMASAGEQLAGLGKWLISALSPVALLTAVVGGLAVAGAALVASFQSAQREITVALSGIGRASGTTRDQINEIAASVASFGGLSVSEARTAATAFAATGKVATDAIAPAVAASEDLAVTLGVDTVEAAKVLAKALADPARGVDELNPKLGAWSDRTKTLIIDLQSQGRTLEAQRLYIKGVEDSTLKAAEATGFWAQAWNKLGTAASNIATSVGDGLSKITGIGVSLNQQRDAAQRNLDAAEKGAGSSPIAAVNTRTRIAALRAEIDRLTAAIERNKAASKQTDDNERSLKSASAIRAAVPEIGAREDAKRRLDQLQAERASPSNSLSPEVAKGLDLGIARQQAILANIKSAADQSIESSRIAAAALDAKSPAEIASITRLQTYNQVLSQGMSVAEASAAADAAAATARLGAQQKLSESSRSRFAAVQDLIGQSEIEIQAVGKSSAQAELLRENWKAYADLRREAEQNHVVFDQAQYERLVKQNELVKQLRLEQEGKDLGQELMSPSQQFAQEVAHLQELRAAEAISYETYQQGLVRAEANRVQATQQLLSTEVSWRQQTMQAAAGLLDQFGQKNKSAAVAAILLNKAVAAEQVIQNTAVAAMAAAASAAKYGPIAAGAAAASMVALGAVQLGVIAATGALEISSIGSSSSSSVSASPTISQSTSDTTASASTSQATTSSSSSQGKTIVLNGKMFDREQIRDLMKEWNVVVLDGVGSA